MADHELTFERLLDAPPEKVYRAWTEPELLTQWFTPAPWSTPSAELDVRPGGSNLIVMRDPEGKDYPNHGVYLEVVENRRLVMTDAYTSAWEPSAKPYSTLIVTFEPQPGGRTLYRARMLHWTAEDRQEHESMGFHDGWAKAADQLEALLERI